MTEQLQELARSGPPWAQSRAAMALAIAEQYEGGGLDHSEYQELMRDLVRSDQLNSECDDQDMKNLLVAGVFALAKLS